MISRAVLLANKRGVLAALNGTRRHTATAAAATTAAAADPTAATSPDAAAVPQTKASFGGPAKSEVPTPLRRTSDRFEAVDNTGNSSRSAFWMNLRHPSSNVVESSRAAVGASVDEFRTAVERGYRSNAWSLYNALMGLDPKTLTLEDHLRMMSFFYDSPGLRPYERFRRVYTNMHNLSLDIPMPVYEAICQRAVVVEPAQVLEYYQHALARFGSEQALPPSLHAALMNAYRRSDTPRIALEHMDRIGSEGYDVHELKPIAMDVCLRMGAEEKAKQFFDSFVTVERRPAALARVYGWLAMALQRRGRDSEATAVLNALTERGIIESATGYAVRIRIAVKNGDFKSATEILQRRFSMARRTPRADDAAFLVLSYLRANDEEGAKAMLKFFSRQFETFPRMRFDPFFPYMLHVAKLANSPEPAIAIFNSIPTQDKYRSLPALRHMCRVYLKYSTEADALAFLQDAVRRGAPLTPVEINLFLDEIKKEVSSGRMMDRDSDPDALGEDDGDLDVSSDSFAHKRNV